MRSQKPSLLPEKANFIHPNTKFIQPKFTMELGKQEWIPFLKFFTSKIPFERLSFRVCSKSTYTDRYHWILFNKRRQIQYQGTSKRTILSKPCIVNVVIASTNQTNQALQNTPSFQITSLTFLKPKFWLRTSFFTLSLSIKAQKFKKPKSLEMQLRRV